MITKDILEKAHKGGFDEKELYGSYKIFFGTLVSGPRLKIINCLIRGKKNVSELMEEIKMDQTSVSHNLARLRQCGFVQTERKGKFVYYKLNEKTIKPLMEIIEKHMLGHCIHILRSMEDDK